MFGYAHVCTRIPAVLRLNWFSGMHVVSMFSALEHFLKAVCFVLGKEDDYEGWVPHGEADKQGCLLGKKVTIQRPKKEAL